MAEERNVGIARATDDVDEEPSKAELQRRMEEARENISQTVAEIKDTVMNQYQAVKETLDWREQVRRRPIAWSAGALGVGFLVGYGVAAAFKGDGDEYDTDTEDLSSEDTRIFNTTPAPAPPARAYAAQAIAGGAYGSSSYAGEQSSSRDTGPLTGYDKSYGASQQEEDTQESEGPGLMERFRQTKAYDRLEAEVSTLGERFVEELSKTAQSVVLPALFSKIKDLFGFDLTGKQPQGGQTHRSSPQAAGTSGIGTQSGGTQTDSGQTADTGGGGAQRAGGTQRGTQSGGSSYGTSENQAYGASAQGGGQQSNS